MKKCLSVLLIIALLWCATVTAIAEGIEFEDDSVDIVALEIEPEQTDETLGTEAMPTGDDVSGDMGIDLIDGLDLTDGLVSPEMAAAQDGAPVANGIVSNAVEWNGHYYQLMYPYDVQSWEQAKAYCESLGGYLATITSAEEDAFVFNHVVYGVGIANAYFGLSDAESERTWKWVTGEEYVYSNWASGEPNNAGNEDYAMYYYKNPDGKWNDGSFRGRAPFICEWSEYAGQGRGTDFVIVDGVLERYTGNDAVVTIPAGVNDIGYQAFWCNEHVKEVIVPEGVQNINGYAFKYCESLGRVSLPNSLTYISMEAFASTGLTSAELPNSVTSLGDSAFANCPSLSSVKMSDSMTSVPNCGFLNCKNLTNVVLPNKVAYINQSAFQNTSLNEVILPNTVTHIGSSAYADCPNLITVVIPSSVTSISSDAFQNSHPTVYCEPGSYAETYATQSNLPTRDIDEAPGGEPKDDEPTDIVITKGKSATAYVGKKLTLKAKLTPSDARTKLTWTSSNKKVATVSRKGVVKPKKAGKVVITVKTANGKSAKITIKVVDVKSIKLREGKRATLKVGKQLTLHVKVNPSKVKPTVKWTSSNRKVATVSGKGVVKALKPGKVKITARTGNGKTASITITVKK